MEHRWLAIDVDAPALPRKRGRLSLAAAAALFLLALFCAGCRNSPPKNAAETNVSVSETKFSKDPSVPRKPIDEVIAQYTNDLLAIDGVEVVFAGEDQEQQPVITIGVSKKTESTLSAIPKILEGYPVVIQETGPVAPR